MQNVEVKAALAGNEQVPRRLPDLGFTRQRRLLEQTDRYFQVPRGRLKLRQHKGDRHAELIFYVRSTRNTPRASDFQRLTVDDPAHLLRLLRGMFTPGVCVRKKRELWLRDDVRVHVDDVAGLGRFLEIEVPVRTGRTAAAARRVMAALVRELDITRTSMLADSYADLLARR